MLSLIAGAALGGAIGSGLRISVIVALGQAWPTLPVATLLVNVVGCIGMGATFFWLREHHGVNGFWYALVAAGLFGGLTTFSTFALDFWMVARKFGYALACGYAIATTLGSLIGFWLGEVIYRGRAQL